jgi:hypothetical protein
MSRVVLHLLLALILVSSPSILAAAQDGWQTTTDKEGGFAVSFPGKPTYQQFPDRTYGFTSEGYSFYYQDHNLMISFVPLDPAPRTPVEALKTLNAVSASYTGFGKLVRQDKLPDGGRQYENVYSQAGMLFQARTRLYVRHGNLYTLSCTADASSGINEQIAAQFFSSFRFLEDLPPRPTAPPTRGIRKGAGSTGYSGWYMLRGPDGDFSVEFPSKPEYRLSSNEETGIRLHQYLCFFGRNHFAASYREMVKGEGGVEQIAGEAVKALLDSYPSLRLVRHSQLPGGGYEVSLRGEMVGELAYMQTRFYVRGRRLYIVSSTAWNLSESNDPSRFFGSFRLL